MEKSKRKEEERTKKGRKEEKKERKTPHRTPTAQGKKLAFTILLYLQAFNSL